MVDFSDRLRAARTAADFTQEQLGLAVGVSKQAVSDWENGRQHPSFQLWDPLRKELGVTLDHLIGGDPLPRRVQEETATYGERLPPDLRRLLELGRRLTPRKLKLLVTFLGR
ncbi:MULTISPECIES: helix-turn-helix transcriptional regulator [Dyella]|nr:MULTISPECIES: helix-turn-helix transcriptional regulator [Dyella]MDR3444078.1 helix-turn-helix transcriptional regulator [Dyella sp.]PMQ06338.1 HTH-type transcriptional regulator Xre [Dyella sp. AD56]ULU26229.1 helix-turn-helix transcriptional regulator [Dyella terrae]